MRDGIDPFGGEDGASSGLDEFLCEYVDGTMDPVVRGAFEDYLRANPDLYHHIESLRHTRSMLCRYGCRLRAPAALQQRLRERLGQELVGPPPVLPAVADRLSWIAGVSSLLLLVCGVLAASYELRPEPLPVAEEMELVQSGAPQATPVAQSRASYRTPSAVSWMPAYGPAARPAVRSATPATSIYLDAFMSDAATLRPMLTAATLP